MSRKVALTIAGSDCSGGAGIQADLKTFIANGVYGMSAITALTAQNTVKVSEINVVKESFLEKQLESIFEDIKPDATKIGMVSTSEQIDVIVKILKKYKAKNIVVDPVIVSTSGCNLSNLPTIKNAIKKLFPISTLITPNISEAQVLSNSKICNNKDMETAAEIISNKCKCSVLLKGGHNIDNANDVYYDGKNLKWFMQKRIENNNTHGTGCTLSSAITANLAKGQNLETSIKNAKEYITKIMQSSLNLGKASGPLDHSYLLN